MRIARRVPGLGKQPGEASGNFPGYWGAAGRNIGKECNCLKQLGLVWNWVSSNNVTTRMLQQVNVHLDLFKYHKVDLKITGIIILFTLFFSYLSQPFSIFQGNGYF